MFTGLVLGIVWGCWEEKKFVFRNCLKEYHLRESPIRLFSVMRRSVTTAPVVATFIGVHSGLRCWWHQRQLRSGEQQAEGGAWQHEQQQQQHHQQQHHHQQVHAPRRAPFHTGEQRPGQGREPKSLPGSAPLHQPVLAGTAGAAAGAVRTLLAEAALSMHPLVHAQRSAVAGLAAAGIFALGGFVEEEQRRQRERESRLERSLGLAGGN